jgi:hypothetical protein
LQVFANVIFPRCERMQRTKKYHFEQSRNQEKKKQKRVLRIRG